MITGEWHALLDLTVLVSKPLHLFHHCLIHTQPSHAQQCEYGQCGDEHQKRQANDSWFLHDCWNHCYSQHHNSNLILDINDGLELWMYLDPVPILHPFHQCNEHPRDPWIGRTNSHSACSVLWYECDLYHSKWQVIQVYSSLVRSSDLKIAN